MSYREKQSAACPERSAMKLIDVKSLTHLWEQAAGQVKAHCCVQHSSCTSGVLRSEKALHLLLA